MSRFSSNTAATSAHPDFRAGVQANAKMGDTARNDLKAQLKILLDE
jgi:hypothetical protein